MGPRADVKVCGKSRPPTGLDPWTVQPAESRCIDYIIQQFAFHLQAMRQLLTGAEFRGLVMGHTVYVRSKGRRDFVWFRP